MDYEKLENLINQCIQKTINASSEEVNKMKAIYDKYVSQEKETDIKLILPDECYSNREEHFVPNTQYSLTYTCKRLGYYSNKQQNTYESTNDFINREKLIA